MDQINSYLCRDFIPRTLYLIFSEPAEADIKILTKLSERTPIYSITRSVYYSETWYNPVFLHNIAPDNKHLKPKSTMKRKYKSNIILQMNWRLINKSCTNCYLSKKGSAIKYPLTFRQYLGFDIINLHQYPLISRKIIWMHRDNASHNHSN